MKKFISAYSIRGIIIANMIIGNSLILFFAFFAAKIYDTNWPFLLTLLLTSNIVAFCILYICLLYIRDSKRSSWNNAEYFLSGFFATVLVVYFSAYFNFAFFAIMKGEFLNGIFGSFLVALFFMPIIFIHYFLGLLPFAIFNGFLFMRYGKLLSSP